MLLACDSLKFDIQQYHVLKKFNFTFDPSPKSTQGSDTGLRSKVRFDMFLIYCTSVCICYHVAAFAIPFDMQHDNVLKKFNFNLLTPRALGGSAGEIFATMRLHL